MAALAQRKPGKLLKDGSEKMYALTNPSSGILKGDRPELPAAAMLYLQNILKVTQSAKMKGPERRELETLAAAMDLITDGCMSQAGDLLMQRFKSLETAVREQAPNIGRLQELLPGEDQGLTSIQERSYATRQLLRTHRLNKVAVE